MDDVLMKKRDNLVVLGGLFASVLVNILFWIYVFLKSKALAPPIIIRYNVYFGAELMGAVNNLYMLPLIGVVLIAVNAAMIVFLRKKARVASNLLLGTLFLSQIFLFIAGVSLVMINT